MKVLLINGSPNDASSFYRSNSPLSKIEGVEILDGSGELSWSKILPADVVYMPRPASQNCVSILEYVKKCQKPIWIDHDDSHLSIPETNPAFDKLMNPVAQACFRRCVELADVITVSTEAIRNEILELYPEKMIVTIPNAADDSLFDLTPSYHERNKIIVIRGGGSHDADIEEYKDSILQLINDYPEYKWAFMGYCPRFVVDSGISDDRLMIFQYSDLMKYFEILMELKPEIMIVPLQQNKFNECKSNIALIEGTLAGAVILAPNLPEFREAGACCWNKAEDIVGLFNDLITDKEIRYHYYDVAIDNLPKLSYMNFKRKMMLENLLLKSSVFSTKNVEGPNIASDQEFFNHCLTHGHTQDNKSYEQMHRKAVDWLIEKLDPKTVVEFGSGPGATIEYFHDKGIPANGLEINPLFIEHFNKRNPHLTEYMHQCDFVNETELIVDVAETGSTHLDLGISIEVFEHIDMPERKWSEFIFNLSQVYKHFYFSSTPFRDKPSWDYFWGHKNIRTTASWIKLFEQNGWELIEKPKILTSWDLLFVSKNV